MNSFAKSLTLFGFVAALGSPICAFAVNWEHLDVYRGKRTLEQIKRDMSVLIQADPSVEAHFRDYFEFSEDEIKVLGEGRKIDYSFAIETVAPNQIQIEKQSPLEGLRIALDGNNLVHLNSGYPKRTQEITRELGRKLTESGANVFVTPFFEEQMDRSKYSQIVQAINEFAPDVTVAIRFKSGGEQPDETFLSFCPGCFMNGEVATEASRYRFMHALVSGKVDESKKLAIHIAA